MLLALLIVVVAIVVTNVIVSSRLSAPRWTGARSDHFDGRTFDNLESFPDKTLGDILRWRFTSRPSPWSRWVEEAPGPKPLERVDDGTIRVTLVNHATLLIQMDGVNLLTDPVYSDRASPFGFMGPRRHRVPGIRFEDLPPIDAILLSHNHYDHMDLPTLRRLQGRARSPIVVPLGNTAYLTARGVPGATDVDWWQATSIGRLEVTATPAQHWSARWRDDRRRTLWAAYMISGPSGRVYFGGDSGYARHFALTRERLGVPDVALLPIGAFMPVWFMHPAHMAPEEAVQASRDLGASHALPIHYGTWQLGDDGDAEPEAGLLAALATDEAQRRVWRIARHGHAEVFAR